MKATAATAPSTGSAQDSVPRVLQILASVKKLAREYKALTERPLGCTGEIAEYEAARILKLELAPVRQAGYDAVRESGSKKVRVQIKGRVVTAGSSGRVPAIDINKPWDVVMLVLLDENLDAIAIHEAGRDDIEEALLAPGSKSRNLRGQMAISKFKSIARVVWKRKSGR